MQDAAQAERGSLEQQRIDLTAQRQKLLEAHYAGAVPIDLLKTEQERLSSQLQHVHDRLDSATTNYERIRETLSDTLDLARDCHTAYLNADDSTRRLFNQAFFARIWIHEDPVTAGHSVRVD